MQKIALPPAMYHGANSFAKELYRETFHAGFGRARPLPHHRIASKYGRWQSVASPDRWQSRVSAPGLPLYVLAIPERIAVVSELKRLASGAIVLCNAPAELVQGAIAFSLD